MPNFLEVAKLISGRINSNEFSAALSASDPLSVDIPDEEFEKIKTQVNSLITIESAANNVEVSKLMKPKLKIELESDMRRELKKSIYDTIEEKVANIGTKLGVELSGKAIDEQLGIIVGAKVKTLDAPDNEAYTKLQSDFASFKETAEKDKEKSKEAFKDFQINSTLRNKISSIPLSKAYQDDLIKDSLFDRVVLEVRSKAAIQLNEAGQITKLLNPENKEMELFDDNNKKIGIDDIINPLMQPYLQATPPKPPSDKPVNNLETLPDGMNSGSAAAQVRGAENAGVKY